VLTVLLSTVRVEGTAVHGALAGDLTPLGVNDDEVVATAAIGLVALGLAIWLHRVVVRVHGSELVADVLATAIGEVGLLWVGLGDLAGNHAPLGLAQAAEHGANIVLVALWLARWTSGNAWLCHHHMTVVVAVVHVVMVVHLVVTGRVRLRVGGASLSADPTALADLLWWGNVNVATTALSNVLEAPHSPLIGDASWNNCATAVQADHAGGDLAGETAFTAATTGAA
jgi:hypothetical protein